MPSPEFIDPVGGCYLTYTDGSGALRVIAFDATISVRHSGQSDVAEHPVARGVALSDNSVPKPRRATISAHVTNTPIFAPQGSGGAVSTMEISAAVKDLRAPARASGGGGFQLPGIPGAGVLTVGRQPITVTNAEFATGRSIVGAQVLQFPTPFDRLQDVWDDLEALRINGTEIAVVSRVTQYPKALIVSVDGPEDAADALALTIEIREIVTADTRTVTVDPPVSEVRAQPKKATGGSAYTLPEDSRRTTTMGAAVEALTSALGL